MTSHSASTSPRSGRRRPHGRRRSAGRVFSRSRHARARPSTTLSATPKRGGNSDYQDGEYTATGWYGSLPSHQDVTLTIADDTVTAVEITTPAENPTSLEHQQRFAAALPEAVIGARHRHTEHRPARRCVRLLGRLHERPRRDPRRRPQRRLRRSTRMTETPPHHPPRRRHRKHRPPRRRASHSPTGITSASSPGAPTAPPPPARTPSRAI